MEVALGPVRQPCPAAAFRMQVGRAACTACRRASTPGSECRWCAGHCLPRNDIAFVVDPAKLSGCIRLLHRLEHPCHTLWAVDEATEASHLQITKSQRATYSRQPLPPSVTSNPAPQLSTSSVRAATYSATILRRD